MGLPDNYFDRNGIGTLAGSSGAVFIVNSVLFKLVPTFDPRWIAFVLSLALGIGRAVPGAKDWLDYVLGVLNGCLIFLTAAGGNQAAGAAETRVRAGSLSGKSKEQQFRARRETPTFFESWF
jgi:hypothetical protein